MKHAGKSFQNDVHRYNFERILQNHTIYVMFDNLKALLMKICHSNFQNSNFSILVDRRKWQDKGLGNLFWFNSLFRNNSGLNPNFPNHSCNDKIKHNLRKIIFVYLVTCSQIECSFSLESLNPPICTVSKNDLPPRS